MMNPLKKTIAITSFALLAHLSGRLAESYDHIIQKQYIKAEIINSATKGYTWKEGSDPHFNEYNFKLLGDEDMTMAGYLVNKNNEVVGMIRKGGYVGTNVSERAQHWGEKIIEESKDHISGIAEKTQKAYQEIKKETKEILD